MPTCPICSQPLETVRQREGVFYFCRGCHGHALTIPQLRRVAGDRFAARLLRLIKLACRASERPCPFCHQAMKACTVIEPPLEFDGCLSCNAAWFDEPTYETIPEGAAVTTSSLPLLATELFAEMRLKEMKEREEAEQKKKRKKKSIRDL